MLCTTTTSVTITEPASIVIITVDSIVNVSSAGANDGEIYISVNGGTVTGDYSYLWSNSETTQNITNLTEGTYSVTVTDDNGCIVTESSIQIAISSINNLEGNDVIEIYPNPTKGELYITNAVDANIYIYNILGKVVVNINNAGIFNTIDMSAFNEGTYIIRILIPSIGIITKKVILVK